MTLTVDIGLPPVGCAQNTRQHWRVRDRADRAHREEARLAGLQARRAAGLSAPAFGKIVVRSTWYMARREGDGLYRPLDGTNAQGAMKAALDGLVDAGLVSDDRDDLVQNWPPVLLRLPEQHGGRIGIALLIEGLGEVTDDMRAEYVRRQEAKAIAAAKRALKMGAAPSRRATGPDFHALFDPKDLRPRKGGKGRSR